MSRTNGSSSTHRPETDARASCWRAMRVLRTFNLPQLVMTAGINRANARSYLIALARVGIVGKVAYRQSGRAGSFDHWRLLVDLGPSAPIVHKDKTVFDPNKQRTYGVSHDPATIPSA